MSIEVTVVSIEGPESRTKTVINCAVLQRTDKNMTLTGCEESIAHIAGSDIVNITWNAPIKGHSIYNKNFDKYEIDKIDSKSKYDQSFDHTFKF